jgi:RNA recognition motif-containing protein
MSHKLLEALFSTFGKVQEAYIIKDHKTGKGKGYGYVIFQELNSV